MKLAITVCATKKYAYAMLEQCTRVVSALNYAEIKDPVIILISDTSGALKQVEQMYKDLLPEAEVILKQLDDLKEAENYKTTAQLCISRMRTAAFNEARKMGVDYCLSLDSDVLPAVNGIDCCLNALKFDKGYYGVACMLYTSQGGGPWLCGRGTLERPILPDFYPEERSIPERYFKYKTKLEESLKLVKSHTEAEPIYKKIQWLTKRFDKYPPTGNVFTLNGKKWMKRGWFDQAYPSIGKGSMVPTDWCGFGATMLSKKALAHASFDGYQGLGTEDLYVCFHKWKANEIKLVAISHCVCDHIVRSRKEEGKFIHVQGHFEESGECEGHLRQRHIPFIEQVITKQV